MEYFIKDTVFSLVNDEGDIFVKNISDDSLIKEAGINSFDKAIQDFVAKKLRPVKGKSYLLINAMGASEYFSSNLNADWFSDKVLENYHKTFEQEGHVYRHHVNKDKTIANGKVIFSHYNKKMHRVELIVEVDDNKVTDILAMLSKNEIPATSMACKVSHDICSICGNKAKRREDYCIHLKHFKNKIHTPTTPIPGARHYGQKVYAINPDPKFFDISFVKIPADATSSVLTKLAEVFSPKRAEITKRVTTPIKNSDALVQAAHGNLTKEEMKALLEKYSMPEIMTHMIDMNMFPSRKDFQYMQMISDGLSKEADICYDNNITFDCSGATPNPLIERTAERINFNISLAEELTKFGERIGLGKPLVLARILSTDFEKVAEDTTINSVPYFLGVGGGYWGWNQLLDKKRKWVGDVIKEFGGNPGAIPPAAHYRQATALMRKHPILFASGLVGAGLLTNALQRSLVNEKTASVDADYLKGIVQKPGFGQFLTATALVSPLVFLYSAHNRKKIKEGRPTTFFEAFTAKHPYTTALGGVLSTYIPKKIIMTWNKGSFAKAASLADYLSYVSLTDAEKFNKLYENIYFSIDNHIEN